MVKSDELTSHQEIMKKFKCILLGEESQSESLHTVRFQVYDILKVKTRETVKKFSGRQKLSGKEG